MTRPYDPQRFNPRYPQAIRDIPYWQHVWLLAWEACWLCTVVIVAVKLFR